MSRFYDVLKQASRSVHAPQESSGPGGPEGQKKTRASVPPEVAELLETANAANFRRPQVASDQAPAAGPSLDTPVPTASDMTAVEPRPDAPVDAGPATEPPSSNGVFGTVAQTHLDHTSRILPHTVDSMIAEHYRLLRTQLLQAQAARPFRSVLITSAGPGEGKTVTLFNLGLAFAMLPSFKVLVVDGDLRRGTIGSWLGARPDQIGFGDLLEGTAQLEDVVLKSDEIPISFMVRGTSKVTPAELLHSPRLHSGLREMARRFDLILVDSPPTNVLTDPQLLASACDAVLLVARAYTTTQKALQEAASKLHPFYVVGSVLNGAASPSASYGYHPYY